jgi:Bifunctional DNA primase/polymerase, N-terminal
MASWPAARLADPNDVAPLPTPTDRQRKGALLGLGYADPLTCHEAALDLYRRGRFVIFVYGVHPDATGKLGCDCRAGKDCKSPGKHPRMARGYQNRPRPDVAAIDAHYAKHPNDNVGILTTGLIVIDLDIPKDDHDWRDSEAEWKALQQKHGRVPETLTAISGSGGRHLLFSPQPGLEHITQLPMLRATSYKGVIDVKSDGGLIVTAPSLHECGNHYGWLDINTEIAVLPTWLYEQPEDTALPPGTIDPLFVSNPKTPPAPRKPRTPKDLDDLDLKAEALRASRVSPDALLGLATIKLVNEGRPGRKQSHVIMSVCLGAASVGYDPDKLYAELLNAPGGLGLREAYDEGGWRALHERYNRATHQAYRWLAEHVDIAADFRAEAESTEWPNKVTFSGRNGTTQHIEGKNCQTVLAAGLAVAEATATTAPMLGCDDLAGMTGLNRHTVRKGLQVLEALGWWKAQSIRSDGRQHAFVYRFELDPTSRSNPSLKVRAMRPKKRRRDPERWLWAFLDAHRGVALCADVRAFAEDAGISFSTIQRTARKLGVISTRSGGKRAGTEWWLPVLHKPL